MGKPAAKKPASKPNGAMPVIEKGIPVPLTNESTKGYAAIIRKMEIGDSVLLPVSTAKATQRAAYAVGAGRYKVRKEGNGARVWRIA